MGVLLQHYTRMVKQLVATVMWQQAVQQGSLVGKQQHTLSAPWLRGTTAMCHKDHFEQQTT